MGGLKIKSGCGILQATKFVAAAANFVGSFSSCFLVSRFSMSLTLRIVCFSAFDFRDANIPTNKIGILRTNYKLPWVRDFSALPKALIGIEPGN